MNDQATEETAHTFNRDGFVMVRGLFSETDLGAIDEHVARFVADVAPTLPSGEACFIDTVHYRGANPSPNRRRQLAMPFHSSRARRDEEAYAAYRQGLTDLHTAKLRRT